MRKLLALIMALAMVLGCVSFAAAEGTENVITIAMETSPCLDPHWNAGSTGAWLQSLMYEEAVLIIRIGKQIDEMENPTYSRILHLRYEENMQFIDISRMIGQTHKYTCNLHGKALDDFSKMYL